MTRTVWWGVLAWIILSAAGLGLGETVADGPAPRVSKDVGPGQTERVTVDANGAYTNVDAAGLARMLHAKAFPLINVHIPYEGEIAGTDLFIPFDRIEANLEKLPADKHARVVLYCRSGSMSTKAARALVKRGYTDVWNLAGGMIGWERAGYPLAGNR